MCSRTSSAMKRKKFSTNSGLPVNFLRSSGSCVATQDPELRKKFTGKPEFVENFFRFIAEEVREHMAQLGFRTLDEMIGRVDRLNYKPAVEHWKAKGLDYSAILHQPEAGFDTLPRCVRKQDHG